MMRFRIAAIVAGLMLALASVSALAFSTPERTGWVTDAAGILDNDTITSLSLKLQALQQKTGAEVVVVTLDSLQNTSIENWGSVLGDTWKIGRANGGDNGALLIVAPNDRQVRIAVGYGLGNRISDAVAASIVSDHILPYFRNGEMARGIRAGVDSIIVQLGAGAGATDVERVSTQNVYHPSLWSRLRTALMPSHHVMVGSFWLLVCLVGFVVFALMIGTGGLGSRYGRRWDDYDNGWRGSSSSSRNSSWGSSSSGSSWGGSSSSGSSSGGSFRGGATGSW